MCQKGFRVDFNKNTCTIQGPSNTHMVIMKEVNKNLFQIPVFLPISQNGDDISNHAYLPNMEGTPKIMSMKMMLENIRIWHNALGHPGATLMKKLTKNGKIPRFRHSDIEEVINRCNSCNMAKVRAPRDCIFQVNEFPMLEQEVKDEESSQSPEKMSNDMKNERDAIPISLRLDMINEPITENRPIVEQIPSPGTPPLHVPDEYFPSRFQESVASQPRLGLRSGRDHHNESNIAETIDEILCGEVKDFSNDIAICDGIDDLIEEHIENGPKEHDIPKNIHEVLKMPEAMEAAEREIEMIKNFQTWKLVPKMDVPKDIPIYTSIWQFTQKVDGWMKAILCFPGHCQPYLVY